ncbi:MAG TPA: hypothetical protein VHQ47_15125 [Phycisphaerae bacterium]|nr:hypothetical protein [Phycisphaerae bacterium]
MATRLCILLAFSLLAGCAHATPPDAAAPPATPPQTLLISRSWGRLGDAVRSAPDDLRKRFFGPLSSAQQNDIEALLNHYTLFSEDTITNDHEPAGQWHFTTTAPSHVRVEGPDDSEIKATPLICTVFKPATGHEEKRTYFQVVWTPSPQHRSMTAIPGIPFEHEASITLEFDKTITASLDKASSGLPAP